ATDRLRLPEVDPPKPPHLALAGPAGTETIILLARTSSLTEDVSRHLPPDVRGALAPVVKQMPPDRRRAYDFTCRQEEFAGGLKAPAPAAGDEPLAQVQALLRHCWGPHFALIRAISFANRGC